MNFREDSISTFIFSSFSFVRRLPSSYPNPFSPQLQSPDFTGKIAVMIEPETDEVRLILEGRTAEAMNEAQVAEVIPILIPFFFFFLFFSFFFNSLFLSLTQSRSKLLWFFPFSMSIIVWRVCASDWTWSLQLFRFVFVSSRSGQRLVVRIR